MSTREISLPAGFLETLSEKTRKELEAKAAEFKNVVILDQAEVLKMDYENKVKYRYTVCNSAYPDGPKTLDRFENILIKAEYDGFKLISETIDCSKEKIFELNKKSKELDALKTSIAQIKTVLK